MLARAGPIGGTRRDDRGSLFGRNTDRGLRLRGGFGCMVRVGFGCRVMVAIVRPSRRPADQIHAEERENRQSGPHEAEDGLVRALPAHSDLT